MSGGLSQRGYVALVVTQFFGAVNDNILKQVLTFGVAAGGVWAAALGPGGQSYVAFCLTIPFILLSGFAGQLADRYSKSRITRAVKVAEVGIALVALAAFYIGHVWFGLSCMVLLAIQSAFFGPAKYGMIPELVADHELSRANGIINMLTNIAIIVGTVIAGPVYAVYVGTSPLTGGSAWLWLPGVVLVAIAVMGLIAAMALPPLPPQEPTLRISLNPFGIYFEAIREMARSPLLLVALAWAFFYMIGMIAILALPDYSALLQVSEFRISILLGVLGIAIGIGSVAAGFVSGDHIEPRLVPVGAIGMTVFFALLGLLPLHYGLIAALLAGAGIFAGFYIIPLQALLQYLSPRDERGRYLGTANAISFVCTTIGALIFLLARKTFQMPANRVFLICAGLAIVGSGILIWRLRRVIADPRLRAESAAD